MAIVIERRWQEIIRSHPEVTLTPEDRKQWEAVLRGGGVAELGVRDYRAQGVRR